VYLYVFREFCVLEGTVGSSEILFPVLFQHQIFLDKSLCGIYRNNVRVMGQIPWHTL